MRKFVETMFLRAIRMSSSLLRMKVHAATCVLAMGCASNEPRSSHGVSGLDRTRCTLRISRRGTVVDGEPMLRAEAVKYCKRTAGATVVIEDDVPCNYWEEVRAELQRSGIAIFVRGPTGDFAMRGIPADWSPTNEWDHIAAPRCQ